MPSMRTAAIAFLTASGALLLAALAITLYGHRRELDWGNVPTWFAGLFAVIASGISLRNYLVARASFAHTTAKHEDDLAAQARLIVCQEEDLGDGYYLCVQNHSDAVIFNATLVVFKIEKDDTSTYVPLHADGPHPDEYDDQTVLPERHSYNQQYERLEPPFETVMTYTDARGIRWKRIGKKQPERVID